MLISLPLKPSIAVPNSRKSASAKLWGVDPIFNLIIIDLAFASGRGI